MKVILLSFSGHAYAEDASAYKRFVQLEDGDHLVSKRSVSVDVEHHLPSIMVVKQGVSAPEGDDFVKEAVHDSDREKQHERHVTRDKMFTRRFVRKLFNLFYILAVFCMSITVYMLVWVFTWAWFHIWLPI